MEILNRRLERKVKIYIGQELRCENIDGSCSLAVSSYRTAHGTSGRMAVLGPTRMDYPRVVSALAYLSRLMEEVL